MEDWDGVLFRMHRWYYNHLPWVGGPSYDDGCLPNKVRKRVDASEVQKYTMRDQNGNAEKGHRGAIHLRKTRFCST